MVAVLSSLNAIPHNDFRDRHFFTIVWQTSKFHWDHSAFC